MSAIDESNIEQVRLRQKMRAAMREHGLTEVIDNIYSAGDIVDGKLAVVTLAPLGTTNDDNIKASASVAAETYRKIVREGPKP